MDSHPLTFRRQISKVGTDQRTRRTSVLGPNIDALVISAGVITAGYIHETSLDDWNYILNHNLTGAFLTAKYILPQMIENGIGSIVTISSIAAKIIGAGGSSAAYEVSKAGLSHLTKGLAVEYAKFGVRANSILPGKITTRLGEHEKELVENVFTSERTLFRLKEKKNLLNRPGTPREVASLVSWLCSEDASFCTGSDFIIDGGYVLI